MKIVLAPDSYKGSLTANQACDAMRRGILRAQPSAQVVSVPMADGGEGTVDSLVNASGGRIIQCDVTGPTGESVNARYGIMGDGVTAVIEMAQAAGLYLVPSAERNPLNTTTFGVGELIKNALDNECRKFILGIGGSATNDGGVGMAQALGATCIDADGQQIGFGGGSLDRLNRIDVSAMDRRIRESKFIVACDVDNPLCGEFGSSQVFGPQKGATPEMVPVLDGNLRHYAHIVEKDLGLEVAEIPGAGAAGGLGAGAIAFLRAELQRGIDIVIDATGLVSLISGADLVISGEGQCDSQTVRGKTPFGVAKVAQQLKVPVVLIVGSIGPGIESLYDHGIRSVFSIVDRPMTLETAMDEAHELIASTSERVVRAMFGGTPSDTPISREKDREA